MCSKVPLSVILLIVPVGEIGGISPTRVIGVQVSIVCPLVEFIDCINLLHNLHLTIGGRVFGNTINFARISGIHNVKGKGIQPLKSESILAEMKSRALISYLPTLFDELLLSLAH